MKRRLEFDLERAVEGGPIGVDAISDLGCSIGVSIGVLGFVQY